jgi:hypothetical protein
LQNRKQIQVKLFLGGGDFLIGNRKVERDGRRGFDINKKGAQSIALPYK